jgi:hypothetical protein
MTTGHNAAQFIFVSVVVMKIAKNGNKEFKWQITNLMNHAQLVGAKQKTEFRIIIFIREEHTQSWQTDLGIKFLFVILLVTFKVFT